MKKKKKNKLKEHGRQATQNNKHQEQESNHWEPFTKKGGLEKKANFKTMKELCYLSSPFNKKGQSEDKGTNLSGEYEE